MSSNGRKSFKEESSGGLRVFGDLKSDRQLFKFGIRHRCLECDACFEDWKELENHKIDVHPIAIVLVYKDEDEDTTNLSSAAATLDASYNFPGNLELNEEEKFKSEDEIEEIWNWSAPPPRMPDFTDTEDDGENDSGQEEELVNLADKDEADSEYSTADGLSFESNLTLRSGATNSSFDSYDSKHEISTMSGTDKEDMELSDIPAPPYSPITVNGDSSLSEADSDVTPEVDGEKKTEVLPVPEPAAENEKPQSESESFEAEDDSGLEWSGDGASISIPIPMQNKGLREDLDTLPPPEDEDTISSQSSSEEEEEDPEIESATSSDAPLPPTDGNNNIREPLVYESSDSDLEIIEEIESRPVPSETSDLEELSSEAESEESGFGAGDQQLFYHWQVYGSDLPPEEVPVPVPDCCNEKQNEKKEEEEEKSVWSYWDDLLQDSNSSASTYVSRRDENGRVICDLDALIPERSGDPLRHLKKPAWESESESESFESVEQKQKEEVESKLSDAESENSVDTLIKDLGGHNVRDPSVGMAMAAMATATATGEGGLVPIATGVGAAGDSGSQSNGNNNGGANANGIEEGGQRGSKRKATEEEDDVSRRDGERGPNRGPPPPPRRRQTGPIPAQRPRPFCFLCRRYLRYGVDLATHTSTHTTTCHICGQEDIPINEPYAEHGATHVGLQLTCEHEECGYEGYNRRDLWQHANSQHNGTRPWLCLQCGEGFHARAQLHLHVKAMHP